MKILRELKEIVSIDSHEAGGKPEFIDEISSFSYGREDAFKQMVSEAYDKSFKKKAQFRFTPISTDSSLFWSLDRVKMITIGLGELSSAHTANERLNLKQFKDVTEFYGNLVKQ